MNASSKTIEESKLFRIIEEGKPPIVSALEANAKGFEILKTYPIADDDKHLVRLCLINRYLELINSQEYKDAVADPKYSERLEQLTSGDAQQWLDVFNNMLPLMAGVYVAFTRCELYSPPGYQ